MANNREKAWELYNQYYVSAPRRLEDHEFEKLWNYLQGYVRSVITGCKYQYTKHELQEYMADAQSMLWEKAIDRKLAPHDVPMFIGSVRVVVRNALIDVHRRNDAVLRAEETYRGNTGPLVQQFSAADQAEAIELLKRHKLLMAKHMAGRSRFKVVTQQFALKIINHFQHDDSYDDIQATVQETDFWDGLFLIAYLQVLYRQAYYELREQVREAA